MFLCIVSIKYTPLYYIWSHGFVDLGNHHPPRIRCIIWLIAWLGQDAGITKTFWRRSTVSHGGLLDNMKQNTPENFHGWNQQKIQTYPEIRKIIWTIHLYDFGFNIY